MKVIEARRRGGWRVSGGRVRMRSERERGASPDKEAGRLEAKQRAELERRGGRGGRGQVGLQDDVFLSRGHTVL